MGGAAGRLSSVVERASYLFFVVDAYEMPCIMLV